jgi:hypothetical protein
MGLFSFDTNKAFRDVFGIYTKLPIYPTARGIDNGAPLPEFGEAQTEQEFFSDIAELSQNMHNLQVQDRFQFGHPELGAYDLSPYTVMEMTRTKNIVKTQLVGRNGSVKEFISLGDWEFTFRGFLINEEAAELPHEQTMALLQVCAKNQQLKFFSEQVRRIFEYRNVIPNQRTSVLEEGDRPDFIVVEDVRLLPMDGADNVQPFEIRAVSDSPIELELLLDL